MAAVEQNIERVRGFNRFYTRRIGLLREGLHHTSFSLTQARVLFEIGRNPGAQSTSLVSALGLDPGYLSRLLTSFERRRLVKRTQSSGDRRVYRLSLAPTGRAAFEKLNAGSQAEIGEMLRGMDEGRQRALIDSMGSIRQLLDSSDTKEKTVTLRTHRPGDIGWLVARHGELYTQEYGWDGTFEGLVAEIAGKFLTNFDERRERCWIAELDGARVGCVMLVKESDAVAKLRLLLVEPAARGHAIGTRLVEECIEFARECGYGKLTLWTNDILRAARRIYERAGFELVKEAASQLRPCLVGQFWELEL